MGCFDSVLVRCPQCGEDVEFQSKSGPCSLAVYRNDEGVPMSVAVGCDGDHERCDHCDNVVWLRLPKDCVVMVAS